MAPHNFVVMHGDTQLRVQVDADDDVAESAIMAAASAAETMKSKNFVVYHETSGFIAAFTPQEVDEWWA